MTVMSSAAASHPGRWTRTVHQQAGRVGDQDVHPAPLMYDLADATRYACGIAQVHAVPWLVLRGLDDVPCFLLESGDAAARQCDARSFRAERSGRSKTEPTRGCGHQGTFVSQSKVHDTGPHH